MALFVKRSRRHSSQTIYTEKRYYIVVTARHYISGGYTPSRVLKGRLFRSHKGSLHSEDAPTQWFTVFWWSTYCQKIGKRACPFLHAKSSIMDSIRSSLSEREREGSACFDPWPRNDINHVAEAIGVKSSVSISCRHFLLSFFSTRRVNKEWNQCDDDEANCCLALCPFGTALEREESRGQWRGEGDERDDKGKKRAIIDL